MSSTKRSYLFVFFAVLSFVLASSISTLAQESTQKTEPTVAATAATPNVSEVTIKNFGQMDDRFFRGGQPKEKQYKELVALGIKTIIDLRDDPEEYEKREAEALGIRYVHLPMIAKKYPKPETVEEFLKLVDDPSTGKFFVHCAGGRHPCTISVPMPLSVKISSSSECGSRPSMKCTRCTPSSSARTALCTFGRMPLSMTPFFLRSSTCAVFNVEMSEFGSAGFESSPGTSLM